MAEVTMLVELQLADAEGGRSGLDAEAWKPYPYGWVSPEGVSERVAAAMALDAVDEVLAEAMRFVVSQYNHGSPPLAWRITRDGAAVASGTSDPEDG